MKNSIPYNKRSLGVAAAAAFLALVPLLSAWVYCLLDRQYFSQIYLPASSWNDELFYYKMTENVLHYGYPQGYFGFNESHGRYLSFAAWSPVLLVFWVIWGFLFGWNLLSPILCNLTLMSLSMLLFASLVKPDKKQALLIGFLYGAFMPVTRFVLSGLPEAEVFALFIVFLGLTVSCQRKYKAWKIGVMFGLVMLMTWIRPYLILLFLTPFLLLFEKKGKKAFLQTGGIAAVTMIVYSMINHFLSAPYLTDLFYTEWIKAYFEQGIFAGLRYTIWKLWTNFGVVIDLIRVNLIVKSGLEAAAGLYYLIFLLLLLLLLGKTVWRFLYKNWKGFLLEGQMLFGMIVFLAADLLMYRIREGGRHTLVYILGCLFLLPLASQGKKRQFYLPLGISVFFIILFLARGNIPCEFGIPYGTQVQREELDSMAEQLTEHMELTKEAPSYGNTVIWPFYDKIEDTSKMVDFGVFYAVPAGFGINLCTEEYLEENWEKLQSRYIGVMPGGNFEKRCIAAGGVEIGRCESLVVYDMKK